MMLKHNLEKIDKQLIELLGKRMSILAKLEYISLEEQLSNLTSFLKQSHVPEIIWKNLIINCAAANKTSYPQVQIEPRRVTLVGGRGMMGRFFMQRLSAAGHYTTVLEQSDWEQADQLLKDADLVLICVPMEFTVDIVGKVAQYLPPTTALADIASVKAPIVQAMLKHHKGPVMGLHPMFGPGVLSFLSQNVVFCPGRKNEAFQWLLDMIENDGGKLIACEPQEHDKIMVAIQAIRNFTTLSLGVFLTEEKIDIRRSLDFSSPTFRLEIGLVSRLLTQSAPMIVDILLATSERQQAIERLSATYSQLAQLVVRGDRDALIHKFQTVCKYFAGEIDWTVEESHYVLEALSVLVAAKEVDRKQSTHAN